MKRGAWRATVHRVAKSQTRLKRFSMHACIYVCIYIYTYVSEKAMAPHSSTLAWKIPWMEEPGGPQSTGSLRVRQD